MPGDWSPDGRRFAFLRENADGETANFVIDVATHVERQVTEYFPDSVPPSWSPDGRKLLFDDAMGHIYTSRPDGSHRKRIHFRVSKDASVFIPDWAPDGHHIAFNMFTPTGDESGILGLYTSTVGGGRVRSVITSDEKFYGHADWGVAPRQR
jgi:Tol biopolymer transport system component